MFLDYEIERLQKKYPSLRKWGHSGTVEIILYYRQRRRKFRFLNKIFPYRYNWENRVKKNLHKQVPKHIRCRPEEYIKLYNSLDEYNIKWYLDNLPSGIHLYANGLKLESGAHVHRSQELEGFYKDLKSGKFKEYTLSIYQLYGPKDTKWIRYAKIKEKFIIDL